MRDSIKIFFSSKTISIMIILIVIIGFTVIWQRSTDRQQAAVDAETFETYISPGAEFIMQIPKTWRLDDNSFEQNGTISIQLNGPKNEALDQAFAKQTENSSESIGDIIANAQFNKLINSSVGKEYALLQMDIFSANSYKMPLSKEAWRKQLDESNQVASGIVYGKFEDFNTDTADGYKYTVTIIQGDQQITATNYYLLGGMADAEVMLYPADTIFLKEAEAILKTITITPANLTETP